MPTSKPAPQLAQARLIAICLLLVTVGYAVLGTILVVKHLIPEHGLGELEGQSAFLVKTVLLVSGVTTASGSFLQRRVLDGRAPRGPEGFPARFRNMLVGMALAESAGVMGFVVALLTGDTTLPLLLWGVAIAACILHFPTRALLGAQDTATYR